MLIGKLINPRLILKNGTKFRFENTLVIERNGQEIDRMDVGFPYSMPDEEIKTQVKNMVVQYALDIGIEQEPQEYLQWDWMEWDNGNT